MRILLCSEQPPVPPINGVRLVLRALVRELAPHHELRLLSFGLPSDQASTIEGVPTRILPRSGEHRWRAAYHLARALATGRPMRVDGLEEAMRGPLEDELASFDPDLVHVMTGGLAGLGRRLVDRPAVLVPLDAAYRNVEAQAHQSRGLRRRLLLGEAERVRSFEAAEYGSFDRVVVVSEGDRDALLALDPALRTDVIPNGVDGAYFVPGEFAERQSNVVFHGAMNYAPNVRAAEYLARDVWPAVRRRRPDARLVIVGRAPVRELRALRSLPGVELTGEVPDVRPWLAGCKVYACPMLTGTGIKNKLLEAMASGMACVATPLSLSGMTARAGRDLLVADRPELLASEIARLLDEDELAARLGRAARDYVLREHDWAAVAASYERVYESAVSHAAQDVPSPQAARYGSAQ